jgi:hypothetical protein
MGDNFQGMKFNDTFRGDTPDNYNACVGENGSPSYREYADGFADAAIILIDKAIETGDVDEQIYPICFNMRHSVELRLKHQIERLKDIRPEVFLAYFNSAGSHDIGKIWIHFKDESKKVDRRLKETVSEIDGYIKDIAEVDPTGQTFRYPLSNESVKHLVDVSVINIVRLKDRFTELRNKLDQLHRLTGVLIDEYQWGTYTKNLSRADIKAISEQLPVVEKWREESFDRIRDEIKVNYEISSKEFSDCINIIKKHREFAHIIDIDIPLLGCSLEDLNLYFQCLNLINPLEDYIKERRSISIGEAVNSLLDNFEEQADNQLLALSICKDDIELDAIIGIVSLYEFGRYLDYSENYESNFQSIAQYKANYKKNVDELNDFILHNIKKTNACRYIIKSLNFFKQYHTVAELDRLFNLNEYFDFFKG